ncbi:HAD-IA family hydrolase [Alkalihalobacillus sp. AL-G]|uniref:HAD-IA family hydrolase n=1 Tax=Alkalihalobacillus sp. AL-G TaxID=2926399 RepID=UPI002729CD1D|nr:HAD-IA family hydrolase [Alkalihalobacillus sp. AL-G]WLD92165.1 HAD-IA family hydrolase [Alkalihalobacillus sp. AL-G]
MNILWDFDGTIVDSYKLFVSLFKKVLGERISEDEILSHLKVSFSHTIEHYELSDHQIRKIRNLEAKLEPKEFMPFPDLKKVLGLADRNFIVTHNSREVVLEVLNEYQLAHFFTRIIGVEDQFPRKPDVRAYEHIMEDYPINLVVGDRKLDLIPAKKLGIPTCIFQNEKYAEADHSVHSYLELYQLLIKRN